MSDNSYNVVFEYDATMGGAYGSRFWTSYESHEEFEKLSREKSDGTIVIASGINQEEAIDIVSLTPEICRVMCAVEQAFQDETTPSREMVSFHIANAKQAIAYDRQRIGERGLARHMAQDYIDHFTQMCKPPKDIKTATMRGLLVVNLNPLGQVF